jgi:hypothetical protein
MTWTFSGTNGPQRRRRNPARAPIYDIDAMTPAQLEDFVSRAEKHRSMNGLIDVGWAREIYADRPIRFVKASMALAEMAAIRLQPHGDKLKYEKLYSTLPEYAKFRRVFNVEAALKKTLDCTLKRD